MKTFLNKNKVCDDSRRTGKISLNAIFIFLILAFLGASAVAVLFWQKIQTFEPNVYHYVPPARSFIYGQEDLKEFGIEEYVSEKITNEKAKLIERKESFIYLDLKKMELILYEEGEVFEVFPVKSKGRAGSFWETPPGYYFVGDKVVSHFSSVSRVWMPYGIQFYGNFFIHGWPYYAGGQALPTGPSGGCIRLRTADAIVVFEFAERGMPVLVFEEKTFPLLSELKITNTNAFFPEIKSEAFLITDLETGEILANKEMHSEVYADSATKAMLALSASEVINLEKRIIARKWMIEGIGEGIIVPGRSYRGYDLLYPLLSQSSKEAAFVLSRFLTAEYFVTLMNIKAKAIGMNNTNFVDIDGVSEKNITTLYDSARMMRYIKDYRGFIFEKSALNQNFPAQKENLVSAIAGLKRGEKQTVFTVWKMKRLGNEEERSIFIGLSDSVNIEQDIENILDWLDKGFGLK